MPEELTVGLAGCGHIAARHAAAIADVAEVGKIAGRLRLDSAFDVLAERREDFAARHGIAAVRSWPELLGRDPDVVCICAPNPVHAELASAALRAGRHVVIEHPLALSAPEAEEVCRAAEATGRQAFVVRQRRYLGSVQQARRLLARGALGTIREVEANVLWSRPARYYAESAWRRSAESGGVALNQGSHFLDLLLYLFGDPVATHGARGNLRHALPCEDTCAGTLTFPGGVRARVFLTVACRDGVQEGSLTIRGDAGRLVLGGAHWESRVELRAAPLPADVMATPTPAPERTDGDHRELWRRVAAALAGREVEVVDAREGLRAVRLLDDIRSHWPFDDDACQERLQAGGFLGIIYGNNTTTEGGDGYPKR